MSETPSGGMDAVEQVAALLKGDKPAEESAPNAETTEQPGEPAAEDESLGEPGKKALKAEREARTAAEKERDALRRRLSEIEAAGMSDLERAQRDAETARTDAETASVDALRWRVAARFGIGEEDADLFLTGSDEDTLARQAGRLKERTAIPKPDPTQGAQHVPALNGDELTQALARAVGARP